MELTEQDRREFELYLLSDECGWDGGKDWTMGAREISNLWWWIVSRVESPAMQKIAGADTTDIRSVLIHFLDQIRNYERESHNLVGFDERGTEEFVDIYLDKEESNFTA